MKSLFWFAAKRYKILQKKTIVLVEKLVLCKIEGTVHVLFKFYVKIRNKIKIKTFKNNLSTAELL